MESRTKPLTGEKKTTQRWSGSSSAALMDELNLLAENMRGLSGNQDKAADRSGLQPQVGRCGVRTRKEVERLGWRDAGGGDEEAFCCCRPVGGVLVAQTDIPACSVGDPLRPSSPSLSRWRDWCPARRSIIISRRKNEGLSGGDRAQECIFISSSFVSHHGR